MIGVLALITAAFASGLWMMIRPRSLYMMVERRLAPLARRKRRKPDYFAINFTRLAGFFVLMFSILLGAETVIKIVRG